ncbi:MAG: exodeoxyribonuclease VII small subunit [Cyanobacteriota bacterium]|nr:exodeoxyribonuclease VII small subunit [Cyanobacteriota bacterium]
MTDSSSDRPKSRSRPSRRSEASAPNPGMAQADPGVAQLTYREAQAALERSLVELQSDDLDVERMTELYQKACAYADRCDTLLQSVEAEVMLWDPDQPETPPQPLNP